MAVTRFGAVSGVGIAAEWSVATGSAAGGRRGEAAVGGVEAGGMTAEIPHFIFRFEPDIFGRCPRKRRLPRAYKLPAVVQPFFECAGGLAIDPVARLPRAASSGAPHHRPRRVETLLFHFQKLKLRSPPPAGPPQPRAGDSRLGGSVCVI